MDFVPRFGKIGRVAATLAVVGWTGEYATKGRALGERRIALSGYRLADMLVRLKL